MVKLFQNLINHLHKTFDLKGVILFGSRACGTAHKYSDYDILIVADFQKSFRKRREQLLDYTPEISIDLFCFTPSEFNNLFSDYNITIMDAIAEGIILWENNFFDQYIIKYHDFVKRGLKKTDCLLILPS